MVKDDPDLQNMSAEAEDLIIKEVKEHRERQRTGMRTTNKSAAQDYRHAIQQVSEDVRVLIILIYKSYFVPSSVMPLKSAQVLLLSPSLPGATLMTHLSQISWLPQTRLVSVRKS